MEIKQKQFVIVMLLIFITCFVFVGSTNSNYGTVLFTKSDNGRKCWTREDLSLITSRMIFDGILPTKMSYNIDSNKFTEALVEYFRLVTNVFRNSTTGKMKHITLLALSDCIGGYLHRIAIPLTKHGFYIGTIEYDSVEKLYELYNEIKSFLGTNGNTWAAPIDDFSTFNAPVVPLDKPRKPIDCGDLIFYDEFHTIVPLPFFDSKTKPNSIAVPLRKNPLKSLRSKSSQHTLVKFYRKVMHCFQVKKASEDEINAFTSSYKNWIKREVVPRLHDNQFYAAFGSVYRLLLTLDKKNKRVPNGLMSLYGQNAAKYEAEEDEFRAPKIIRSVESGGSLRGIVSVGIGVVIFGTVIVVLYCCYKRKMKQPESVPLTKETKEMPQRRLSDTSKKGKNVKTVQLMIPSSSQLRDYSTSSTDHQYFYGCDIDTSSSDSMPDDRLECGNRSSSKERLTA